MACRWNAIENAEDCARDPASGQQFCQQHLDKITDRAIAQAGISPRSRPIVLIVVTALVNTTIATVFAKWDSIWAGVTLLIEGMRWDSGDRPAVNTYIFRWPHGGKIRVRDGADG